MDLEKWFRSAQRVRVISKTVLFPLLLWAIKTLGTSKYLLECCSTGTPCFVSEDTGAVFTNLRPFGLLRCVSLPLFKNQIDDARSCLDLSRSPSPDPLCFFFHFKKFSRPQLRDEKSF